MAESLPPLARSEWTLMEHLWRVGPTTASQLREGLVAEQGWAYSTVKTMLDRLVAKGYVDSRRVGNVYEYRPKVPRQSVVHRAVDDVLDRVLEGSVTPLLQQLMERRGLSGDEARQLRSMLDAYQEDDPADGDSSREVS